MLVKTVNVTNLRNVLIQVPRYIVTQWQLNDNSMLEVHYDDKSKEITIKPSVYRRSDFTTQGR